MNERYKLNAQLAQMLKGGVIMDVTTPEQARIAEAAGACAVMALEKIPADIRAAGGVARMSDPKLIKEIQNAVSIPVMAKVCQGSLCPPVRQGPHLQGQPHHQLVPALPDGPLRRGGRVCRQARPSLVYPLSAL